MKNKKKTLKYWISKLHLWLGFTSGILVFIIAVTGCLYAFKAEIEELIQPYRNVETQAGEFLPPSKLRAIAEDELPGKKIHAVQYESRDRSASAIFYHADPDYYYMVYMNPYTGRVLKVRDMYSDFFYVVLQGHFYLWLPHAVGQPVVASATLVFVVMMITGLIMWWPKKKKAKQRFTIKWNARWRRKNYDLHNVLGFYMTWIAIILAFTGLVWGFQWFGVAVYWMAGGDKTAIYNEPSSAVALHDPKDIPPSDAVWYKMQEEYPQAATIEVHFPETDSSSIAANANPDRSTYWQADFRFFDQYTLEEIPVDQIYGRLDNATAADKLIRMNYDIHTGAILGLPGKILVFFASLIAASLPVTGFLIWRGRRNKEKKAGLAEQLRAEKKHRKQRAVRPVPQEAVS